MYQLLNNKKQLFTISAASLAIGIILGCILEAVVDKSHTINIVSDINSYFLSQSGTSPGFGHIFISSLSSNFGFLIILAIAAMMTPVFPAVFPVLAYRGLCIGFTCTLLMDSLGLKGVGLTLFSVYPSSLLILPAAVLLAAGVSSAAGRLGGRRGRNNIRRSLKGNADNLTALTIVCVCFTTAGCMLESIAAVFVPSMF